MTHYNIDSQNYCDLLLDLFDLFVLSDQENATVIMKYFHDEEYPPLREQKKFSPKCLLRLLDELGYHYYDKRISNEQRIVINHLKLILSF